MNKKMLALTMTVTAVLIFSIVAAIAETSTGQKDKCPDGKDLCESCVQRGGDGCGGVVTDTRSDGKDTSGPTTDTSTTDSATKQI